MIAAGLLLLWLITSFLVKLFISSLHGPLLANFTLDGLEERVIIKQQTLMSNLTRMKWIKGKDHTSFFCQTQKNNISLPHKVC
jgi:hypothetical protein